MRVIQLKADNFKRLTAVDITPGDGAVVTIAGKNDQGKSSVIDAIAAAIGGVKLSPKAPIKGDAATAQVIVDLGDYIVTRKWRRARAACDCEPSIPVEGQGTEPICQVTCASRTKWGPIDSTLTVEGKAAEEGGKRPKFPSPQALLEKLVGELSFDPLAFLEQKPDEQAGVLRKLAKLDFSAMEAERLTHFNARTEVNREVGRLEALFKAFEHYPDAPAEEISVDALVAEVKNADLARRDAEALEQDVRDILRKCDDLSADIVNTTTQIEELELQIAGIRQRIDTLHEARKGQQKALIAAQQELSDTKEAADGQRKLVPDVTAIEAKIREANDLNAKVRANVARGNVEKQLEKAKADAAFRTDQIRQIDDWKAEHLEHAKFPIDGLGLSENGPTFKGQLLEQASTAAKLRVSVAMGLALNPKLKVLLVHEGNDLDDDSLKLLGELAAEAGAQVWLERIAGNQDGVSIVIEDGAVKP